MGFRHSGGAFRSFRFYELGPRAGGKSSRGLERVGNRGSRRQWLGMDDHGVRTVSRLPRDGVLSRVLGGFLRRPASRHEGRVARDGARAPASNVSQLVSVSSAALEAASRALAGLPELVIEAHHTTYEAGLVEFARHPRPHGRAVALCLGSNIGNFDPPDAGAFLQRIRAALAAGDLFLLGADLVKPESELLLAYDDPLGVTAAFNLNLLARVNHELDGDFDLKGFAHRAIWNSDMSRVEMHLVSLK